MIQSIPQLHASIQKFNELFEQNGENPQVQKLYSTAHYVVLEIRFPGKSMFLYLGRGGGFEGIWPYALRPPAGIRVKDRYLEFLRKTLKNATLGKIIVDEGDRIAFIPFVKNRKQGYLGLFWRGRDLLFLTLKEREDTQCEVFLSWEVDKKHSIALSVVKDDFEKLFELFQDTGRKNFREQKRELVESESYLKKYFEMMHTTDSDSAKSRKVRSKLLRKIKNISDDLNRAKIWKKLSVSVENLKESELDSERVTIDGISFRFYGEFSFYQRRDMIYAKIKSLKRGENILKARLAESEKQLENLEMETGENSGCRNVKVVAPIWKGGNKGVTTSLRKKSDQVDGVRFYKLKWDDESYSLGVGLKNVGNDFLRINWGKKDDYWFHFDGIPGPHLIIKGMQGHITPDIMDYLSSLMRDHAKLEITEIPVMYTQVKNLRGVKGSPGSVTFKKERYYRATYKNDWKEIIS